MLMEENPQLYAQGSHNDQSTNQDLQHSILDYQQQQFFHGETFKPQKGVNYENLINYS
jgi:hypothetical protein